MVMFAQHYIGESVCPKLHRCPFPRERLLHWEHHECRKQQTSHQVYKKLNTMLQHQWYECCSSHASSLITFMDVVWFHHWDYSQSSSLITFMDMDRFHHWDYSRSSSLIKFMDVDWFRHRDHLWSTSCTKQVDVGFLRHRDP